MLQNETVRDQGPHPIPTLGGKRRVLVVDDDKAIQTLLSRTLSFMGHDVHVAGNGLEAMTLFLTGSYDLVITDVQMPLMNGFELSRRVKEQSSKTPVIVVTGGCGDAHWEELNPNCVDAIIPKPFKLKELERTVQGLLKLDQGDSSGGRA